LRRWRQDEYLRTIRSTAEELAVCFTALHRVVNRYTSYAQQNSHYLSSLLSTAPCSQSG
jgi:hypothetical protein